MSDVRVGDRIWLSTFRGWELGKVVGIGDGFVNGRDMTGVLASFEDFFARKYEELEAENARLREDLHSREFVGYGVRPGSVGIHMVKINHVSSYSMPDTSAALEELIRHLKNGDNFRVSNWHSAVEEELREFPWTFDVVMPGKVLHYAVDGDGGVVDYDTMCVEWAPRTTPGHGCQRTPATACSSGASSAPLGTLATSWIAYARGRPRVVTDDERREVARRLREIRPCKSGHIKWWEIARALGLKQPAGWFGWEKFEPDSANRLADLIEPSEPKVRCVAEAKVDGERLEKLAHDAAVELTGIDRDALLALAEDVDGAADDSGGFEPLAGMLRDIAHRIREALGVES